MSSFVEKILDFQDMILSTQQLYSWQLAEDGSLVYSNCPCEELFFSVFEQSGGKESICSHFVENTSPVFITDSVGFSWIAAAQKEAGKTSHVYLLGPFFTIEMSDYFFWTLCARKNISREQRHDLSRMIGLVKRFPNTVMLLFTKMLHYRVTGENISEQEICVCGNSAADDMGVEQLTHSDYHRDWLAEQEMLRYVKEGDYDSFVNIARNFSPKGIGNMCPDNQLRQVKDECIVLAALCSRAAIMGGASAEGVYQLSDYYIRIFEKGQSISIIQAYSHEMVKNLIKRVADCKKSNRRYSVAVSGCMEYVRTRVTEKINLNEMAHDLGYTGYYLSRKFRKETGSGINDYIKRKKIEYAMQLLENPLENTANIGEKLSFSSPSYFAAVFRKVTGMSPTEYQKSRLK